MLPSVVETVKTSGSVGQNQYREFVTERLEVEVALTNYRSTYLHFKQADVVASACLRYIYHGLQFMFNFPVPLFLMHSNKL